MQQTLGRDPFAGDLLVFRGARGDLVKILWHDSLGLSLYAKRLERGKFIWPPIVTTSPVLAPEDRSVTISSAQLAYLLFGSTGVTRFTHSGPERAG